MFGYSHSLDHSCSPSGVLKEEQFPLGVGVYMSIILGIAQVLLLSIADCSLHICKGSLQKLRVLLKNSLQDSSNDVWPFKDDLGFNNRYQRSFVDTVHEKKQTM